MYEFKLPDVGEGIHEAEILNWLVSAGQMVAQDQPILEIQTDKAVVEISSPVAGAIAEIRVPAGTMAHVGDVLVVIEAGEARQMIKPGSVPDFKQTAEVFAQRTSAVSPKNWDTAAVPEVKAPGIAGPGQRVLAAPAVRKLALELDIDLAQVTGSGPAGRVLPEDVRQLAQQKSVTTEPSAPVNTKAGTATTVPQVGPPLESNEARTRGEVKRVTTLPPAGPPSVSSKEPVLSPAGQPGGEVTEVEPLQGLRRRIAERMELAWQIPHVTSFEEVEATNLVALRQRLQAEAERRGTRLTYLPFIVKATVQALKDFPTFNASLDMANKKILLHRYYHLGIATAVPDGLLVPVIRHADRLNLLQIAAELNRLGELAQQRKLSVEELSGSTFTITNFGSFGAYQGTPIINPPEVAILGCGRIEERPVVVQGQVVARPVLPLALSYDHRLIDGAAAGAFLGRLKTLLADPNLLLLELV